MSNPLSWLVLAASTWILVLGVNQLWLSALVVAVSQVGAMIRLRNLSVLLATSVLAIPVSLSMVLIHAPFGTEVLVPLLTTDGLVVAAELSVRFIALISAFLACASVIRLPELLKSVQVHPWLGARLAYILGAAVQLLPQGREALSAVRDANQLRGRGMSAPVPAAKNVAMPLITRLLTAGATRAIPLEVAGMERRGTRTVLRQVSDPRREQILRWCLPLVAIGVVIWL